MANPKNTEKRASPKGKRGSGKKRPGSPRGQERTGRGVSSREREAGAIWLWGLHAVRAALRNPRRSCHLLVATDQALQKLGTAAQRPGLEIRIAASAEVSRLLPPGASHQGVALKAAPLPALALERVLAVQPEESFFLVLDQITDPRNFGAILRSAVAMGVKAVVVPRRRSAEMGGAAAKAACGALDMMPIVEVANLSRALEQLHDAGFRTSGLDPAAETAIEDLAPTPRRALVLGSEGEGLRRLVAEHCDERAKLVIDPRIDSLNVSVAAGIALYVLCRIGRRSEHSPHGSTGRRVSDREEMTAASHARGVQG